MKVILIDIMLLYLDARCFIYIYYLYYIITLFTYAEITVAIYITKIL